MSRSLQSTTELIDLMPLVANQSWRTFRDGQIRNRKGQCPICALVDELTGTNTGLTVHAFDAMEFLDPSLGRRDYLVGAMPAINGLIAAADDADDPERWALKQALGMRV